MIYWIRVFKYFYYNQCFLYLLIQKYLTNLYNSYTVEIDSFLLLSAPSSVELFKHNCNGV
jgi:hypothetical protein